MRTNWRRASTRARGAALALAVLLGAAVPVVAGDGTADEAAVRLEAGRGVCAVRPPATAGPALGSAIPASGTAARREIPTPRVEPGDDDRDLVLLRWSGVVVDSVSADIPFVVRGGTVGLTVRAEVRGSDALVSVELLDPEGELIACAECPEAPAVGEVNVGRGTTQMPSTDRPGWELLPGTYAFRVRLIAPPEPATGEPAAIADVTATLRTDAAATVERTLDLNFVYLPNCGLTPAIADSSSRFALFLDRAAQWMEPTGIRLGTLTHVELDRPEFSVVDGWREAGRMFRTSASVGRRRALNVYCFQSGANELQLAAGFAGAIPGPATNGTRDSGIALRTPTFLTCRRDSIGDCIEAYASLFAHEVGHYVGLYHTTEANLEREDPFSDTPRCEPPSDLRACPDFDHVMFPLIHFANTIWSPGQSLVAKTHPLVRTVAVVAPRTASKRGLVAAAPNPFREAVTIRSAPGTRTALEASVFDVRGRRVRKLAGSAAGVTWDGRDERGREVPGGIYFVRTRSEGRSENLRVVKLR